MIEYAGLLIPTKPRLRSWPGSVPGWEYLAVTSVDDPAPTTLLRRGFVLEYVTLGWNVAGIVVLVIAAITARSVALAGFASIR
jgi:hypothetical protein